ncbi:MAG: CoA transferase [Dehalococcoidia bacterium]|nr:CoA transferase [Dehalococcoidia bacterium]
MRQALEGIRVLDFTIWQQGPVATTALADMGADVIKIEERVGGDPGRGLIWRGDQTPLATYFECHNRNKRGIALDVRKEKGRDVIYRLAKESDIFVQNFRPGVVERLKIDYKTLSEINPRLIYASATGWGSKGAEVRKPAFDVLAQGRGGMLSVTGEPHEPPPLVQVNGAADWTGGIVLAYGILVALYAREKTGEGQHVDVSLLGAQTWYGQLGLQRALFSGKVPKRVSRSRLGNPLYNVYEASDAKWLVLAALQSQRFWGSFCKVLGIPDVENDPRFTGIPERSTNAEELTKVLDKVFKLKKRDEWLRLLESIDMPCAPVQDYGELATDPQMIANENIIDYIHPTVGPVKLVANPVRLSKTPWQMKSPAPEFGQNTEEVLLDLCGYSWEELEQMRAEKVI